MKEYEYERNTLFYFNSLSYKYILFRNGGKYAFRVRRGRLSALSLRSIFKYHATVDELKMQTGKCKLLNGNVI